MRIILRCRSAVPSSPSICCTSARTCTVKNMALILLDYLFHREARASVGRRSWTPSLSVASSVASSMNLESWNGTCIRSIRTLTPSTIHPGSESSEARAWWLRASLGKHHPHSLSTSETMMGTPLPTSELPQLAAVIATGPALHVC